MGSSSEDILRFVVTSISPQAVGTIRLDRQTPSVAVHILTFASQNPLCGSGLFSRDPAAQTAVTTPPAGLGLTYF